MLRELNVIAWMVGVEFRVIKRKKERKKQKKTRTTRKRMVPTCTHVEKTLLFFLGSN